MGAGTGVGVRVESGYRKPRRRFKRTQLSEEVGASSTDKKSEDQSSPKNFKLRDGMIRSEF